MLNAHDPSHGLSKAELAAQTGSRPERIDELVKAGILRPADPDTYSAGDIQRVLVTEALDEAGLSVDLLRRGIEAGVVSFEDTDVIYAAPGQLGPRVEDLASGVGISDEALLRIITAFGMPRPEPASRLHEPDAAHLRAFVEAWRPLGDDELMVRAARAYGDAIRRAAESWLGLFEDTVLAPLADRPVAWPEMRARAFEPGLALLAVGRAMLPWLLDQHLFGLLNQLNFDSIERQLALLGIAKPGTREPSAVVFADLAGYTRLTEELGDEAAAETATRLAVVADDVARRHGGRLVKLLGDGVMLHFPRPSDALSSALELRAAMAPAGLPAAHTGVHAGRVIRRESDLYGRTVNIAARLAAAAAPGEILVTDEFVRALEVAGAETPPIVDSEAMELKGIPEPVSVHRIGDPASA